MITTGHGNHKEAAGKMICLHSALVLLGAIGVASGAKIIMASPQMGSHILEQVTLGEELAARGHQVYMAIGSRYPNIANIEKKGMKTITYNIPKDVLYGVSSDLEKSLIPLIFSEDKDKMAVSGQLAATISYRDCAYMMNDEQFLAELRKLSFDLAIVEPFIVSPCNVILPKVLEIPFVSMAGFYLPWKIGIPALPSFAPLLQSWSSMNDITIISRFRNLLMYLFMDEFLYSTFPQNTTLLKTYAPEFENWYDLVKLSELFITTNDHHLGALFPYMPNYISAAGLPTSKAKQLTDDLEKLVQASNDGVILLSFGSSASFFPSDVVAKFFEAFSTLKQTVVTRFDAPKNVTIPKNVKLLSWLPQNDLLGHPKTKLFITHCGNSGQHEALYHAVPMIGFPLFAEQHRNCEGLEKKGFGRKMSIQDFTPEELAENIREVLDNPKYKATIQKASDAFRDQPMHPKERAAFWIEHVIRHGGRHLRSFSMDMPLYQFLMLDVLGLLLLAAFVILFLIRFVLLFVYRKCRSQPKAASLKLKSN